MRERKCEGVCVLECVCLKKMRERRERERERERERCEKDRGDAKVGMEK
jgi:hypothetical protein